MVEGDKERERRLKKLEKKKSKKKGFMVEWREWFPKRRKRGIVKEIRKR